MKKIVILLSAIVTLFIGCQKAADVPVQSNPSAGTNAATNSDPLVLPDVGGFEPLSDDEYDKLPKYIINSKGGKVSAGPISLDVPPPGNQLTEGSCVGFATGYAVRSYLYHKEKATSYFSGLAIRNDKSIFSPRFIYNSVLRQLNRTKDKGIPIPLALDLMKNTGVCTWADMPYVEREYLIPVNDVQKKLAGNYKVLDYITFSVKDGHLKDYIKDCLGKKGLPVIIGILGDKGFKEPQVSINNGYQLINKEFYWKVFTDVLREKDGSPFRHAITVVGYDDDKNAFKLLNSWGNNWTDSQGILWMDYSLFDATKMVDGNNERVVKEAYAVITSYDDVAPLQTAPTGKIDVSYRCDEKEYRLPNGDPNLGTYRYNFLIHSDIAYDKELKKYLYLITPDKKSYYKIETYVSTNLDGKNI